MHQILVIAIVSIAGFFGGLTLLIVANKAWRDSRDRWRIRRRRELEPRLLTFVDGAESSLLRALGGEPGARDRRVLEGILIDHVEASRDHVRERIVAAFEELGLVDEHLRGLRLRDDWLRANAAEKLGYTRSRRAIPHLTRVMEDDVNPEVRLRAASALGAVGGSSAIHPLVRALRETNRWSTIRIADILSTMGLEVVEELAAGFDEMNLHAKRAAIDIVAATTHTDAGPWLRARLKDDETDVRSRAAHALGAIGDLSAGPALTVALGDSQWPVRAMAAKSLGTILHMAAIDALCSSLRDREWWVRTNAAEALRLMGPDGLEALERMLDDHDPYARHQAVLMLEESGILDDEIARLADSDPARRAGALALVNRLVHAGQHDRLRELAERHPHNEVRALLRNLLPREENAPGTAS